LGRGVVTPDMSSEDPALQPPVLEPWWDGDGEGHPHPGMSEINRSVTQSRRNASILWSKLMKNLASMTVFNLI